MKFASALSELPESNPAAQAAAAAVAAQIGEGPDLVVFFASAHHTAAIEPIRRRLTETLRPRVILGATCQGVIGVGREVEAGPGLSVFAAKVPGATFHPFSYEEIDWPALLESPEALKQTIRTNGDAPKALILLADPFSTPLVKLLPAIDACFPGTPLAGGMASAARRPGENRLVIDGRVLATGAVGLAIAGDLRVDCTVSQGCRAIGRPVVITKAQRHVIQELGGRNAWEVVQEIITTIPERDRDLIRANGLLVGRVINEYKQRFGRGDFLIRNLLGVNEDAGYIAIHDTQTRVGQTIQFHVRDRQTAEEDFQLLLEAQKLHGPDGGALLFSCNGRGTNLFDRPHADAAMVREALGDMPLAGFFAAGELGPVGSQNFIHGHTASLVVFRPGEGG